MYKDGRKKATLGHFKVGDSLVIPLTMLKDSDDSENMVPTPPKRGVTRLGNEAAGQTVPLTNQDLPQDLSADKSIEVLRQLHTDIPTSTHEEQTSLLRMTKSSCLIWTRTTFLVFEPQFLRPTKQPGMF